MDNDIIVIPAGPLAPQPPAIDPKFLTNPACDYLEQLAPGSQRTMRAALDTIAQILDATCQDHTVVAWWKLRRADVSKLRAKLLKRYSVATTNKMMSALRGTLKAAWELEQMDTDSYMRAIKVEQVKETKAAAATGRALTSAEIRALLRACASDQTPAGARDNAILLFSLSVGGLRRAELVALDLADVDLETGRLMLWGKGNKQRSSYVVGGALNALRDWLVLRGSEPGPLFTRIQDGGKDGAADGRLTEQAIYKMCQTRARQAGVKPFTPHDLRRTFISDHLDAGTDLATVAQLAGHANVSTTQRYDRRPERVKEEAAHRLDYQRQTLAIDEE